MDSAPSTRSRAQITAPSCRRQRAPAARKPGVCRRRIGEGGFHGPTSFLTLEEGALEFVFLKEEEPLGHKLPLPSSPFFETSVKLKMPTDRADLLKLGWKTEVSVPPLESHEFVFLVLSRLSLGASSSVGPATSFL